eukprot:IDg22439t1
MNASASGAACLRRVMAAGAGAGVGAAAAGAAAVCAAYCGCGGARGAYQSQMRRATPRGIESVCVRARKRASTHASRPVRALRLAFSFWRCGASNTRARPRVRRVPCAHTVRDRAMRVSPHKLRASAVARAMYLCMRCHRYVRLYVPRRARGNGMGEAAAFVPISVRAYAALSGAVEAAAELQWYRVVIARLADTHEQTMCVPTEQNRSSCTRFSLRRHPHARARSRYVSRRGGDGDGTAGARHAVRAVACTRARGMRVTWGGALLTRSRLPLCGVHARLACITASCGDRCMRCTGTLRAIALCFLRACALVHGTSGRACLRNKIGIALFIALVSTAHRSVPPAIAVHTRTTCVAVAASSLSTELHAQFKRPAAPKLRAPALSFFTPIFHSNVASEPLRSGLTCASVRKSQRRTASHARNMCTYARLYFTPSSSSVIIWCTYYNARRHRARARALSLPVLARESPAPLRESTACANSANARTRAHKAQAVVSHYVRVIGVHRLNRSEPSRSRYHLERFSPSTTRPDLHIASPSITGIDTHRRIRDIGIVKAIASFRYTGRIELSSRRYVPRKRARVMRCFYILLGPRTNSVASQRATLSIAIITNAGEIARTHQAIPVATGCKNIRSRDTKRAADCVVVQKTIEILDLSHRLFPTRFRRHTNVGSAADAVSLCSSALCEATFSLRCCALVPLAMRSRVPSTGRALSCACGEAHARDVLCEAVVVDAVRAAV